MAKEQVYIVATHKRSVKPGTEQWDITETVEFVNQLKKRHYSDATAIADYLNRKIVKGTAAGIVDYEKFEEYVRTKYGPQMKQLDKAYRPEDLTLSTQESPAVSVDEAGVITVAS